MLKGRRKVRKSGSGGDRINPRPFEGEGFAYIPAQIWGRGAPPVATALCSILLISIRLSSFDLLQFGTNFRGYIRTCFPIPSNLFLFFNFYARIDQIIKEVFTTCDYIESCRHSQGSFHFL